MAWWPALIVRYIQLNESVLIDVQYKKGEKHKIVLGVFGFEESKMDSGGLMHYRIITVIFFDMNTKMNTIYYPLECEHKIYIVLLMWYFFMNI